MRKGNLMGLSETEEYISGERQEWQVPSAVKDKVARMLLKYNTKATRRGYTDSILTLDETSGVLSGIFVPKESGTFLGDFKEGFNRGDLCEDIHKILHLCTKKCPQCNSQLPALAKECEVCGKRFLKDKKIEIRIEERTKDSTDIEAEKIEVEEKAKDSTGTEAASEGEVRYELSDARTVVESPDIVSYYDTILSYFEEFIAAQKAKPKNEVKFHTALDLDKIDPADEENMTDDDPRWGINSFDVSNVVFSKYNKWKPLFEDKVNSGKPQIFITMMDWQVDLNKVAKFATESGVSHAFEKGVDRYDKEYAKIILSFDDDVRAATNFLCNVATNILSVPKDVPVTIFISSYQSKAKAQKEYKKNNTFGAKDVAKGVMVLLKDKITGK